MSFVGLYEFILLIACRNLSARSAVGESLLNAPCYNLYSRSTGGEFLSLVRCWKLSGRSSGVGVEGVSLTRARVYQVFRRVGETLFQGLHWNLSHRAVGE